MATTNLSEYNFDGISNAEEIRIGIVVSEWNDKITNGLLQGSIDALKEHNIDVDNIIIKYVPGAYELPLGAQYFLQYTDVDAVICLGCVIQGQTKHFDFVCDGCAQGIKDVSLKFNKPVIFGVLTDNTEQQSIDRSGGALGNKGIESAISALKMVALQKNLKEQL